MPNTNKPQGFEPSDTEGKSVRVKKYLKAAGSEIGIGDPVSQTAAGTIALYTVGSGANLLGVSMEYKASAATGDILICDDPEAVYECQASFAFAATDVFFNCEVVLGTVANLMSAAAVNAPATGATLPFKIVGLVTRDDNAVGSFARILVKPNQHAFKAGTAGI